MITKRNIFEKHYYALFFFLFIIVYSCIIPGELKFWKTDELGLSFHAVDYSMGFCSRFLPGAIFNFFFDGISQKKVEIYSSVLMVIFFALLSLFLEKIISGTGSENRRAIFIILLFFITGPSTFSIYIKTLGMLEVYWVFAAMLFFILLSGKKTYALLFVPFLLCVLTYYVTWLCYIPFFAVIILYKISTLTAKKEKMILWFFLIVSVLFALGLTVYFLMYEKGNLVYNIDDFIGIFKSKGVDGAYYEQSLYYYDDGVYVGDTSFDSIFDELLFRIRLNFKMVNLENKVPLFLLLSPSVMFIYSFFVKKIKICKNILRNFSYICMMLLFACTMVAAIFTTTDLIRWTGHAFLPLFASFLYVLYNEREESLNIVKELFDKYSFRTILIYFILYASVVYNPYFV